MRDTPGVSLTETLLRHSPAEAPTAVPLFIGYPTRRPNNEATWVHSFAQYTALFVDNAKPSGIAIDACVNHYFDNGGGPCLILPLADPEGNATVEERIAGYLDESMIENVMRSNDATLICFPDLTGLIEANGDLSLLHSAWTLLLDRASRYRDKFLILDAPRALSNSLLLVEAWFDYGCGSVYWPHLVTDYSAIDGSNAIVPPCGAVAAAIYTTDTSRGVWKAPANIRLDHVIAPEYVIRGRDPLYRESEPSFNLIRALPGQGTRIWGCRTLSAKSPWRYVQTRRLLSHIERNLVELARFAVFEVNNEVTWLKLKGLTRAWLRRLWLRGALAGSVEDQAFRIELGAGESMTGDDLAEGRMIARVRVALLFPAEFVEVKLTLNLSDRAADGVGTVWAESLPS